MARIRHTEWLELLDRDPTHAFRANWKRAWVRAAAKEVGLKVTARTPINPDVLSEIADRRIAARNNLMGKSELKQWLKDGWRISNLNHNVFPAAKLSPDTVYLSKIANGTLTWYLKRLTPAAAAYAHKLIEKLNRD